MDMSPLVEFCQRSHIEVTEAQLAAFETFGEALYEANKVMNLTRIPYDQCALRHFVDSLLVAEYIPAGSNVLDIGSGPGFPAWPLACLRTDLKVTALDGSAKGLKFLGEHPLTNLAVVQARAESWPHREEFDVVTGRALAPYGVQAEVSIPLVKVGGLFVPMRTEGDKRAIESYPYSLLGSELDSCHAQTFPGLEGTRCFAIVKKTKPTPRKYPRRWTDIKTKPLGAPSAPQT